MESVLTCGHVQENHQRLVQEVPEAMLLSDRIRRPQTRLLSVQRIHARVSGERTRLRTVFVFDSERTVSNSSHKSTHTDVGELPLDRHAATAKRFLFDDT
jgi:hypothetical protein